ncbi:hypothetical protein K490DRAFT_53538 [Saccharata proteae CBS 121410]|uniref:Uncharacterized protein n=1 Tax=Saccharata proteae CBS 121410 TaxID=1314787 RepID=A0A9P4LZ10_9PEZI|nr:hypothetical protein K490DRAFT_53538 [Saccharata proteae CBS 121410]
MPFDPYNPDEFLNKLFRVHIMSTVEIWEQGEWMSALDPRLYRGAFPVCKIHQASQHPPVPKKNAAIEALVKAGRRIRDKFHVGEKTSVELEFANFRYPVAGDPETLAKVCCLDIMIIVPSPTEPMVIQAYAANIETFACMFPNIKELKLTWGVHREQTLEYDVEPAISHEEFAHGMYTRLEKVYKPGIKKLSVVVFGENPGQDPTRHAAESLDGDMRRVSFFAYNDEDEVDEEAPEGEAAEPSNPQHS